MSDSTPEPHQPKHRRDGVPLDGAPDLGLYTAPAPVVPERPSPSTWSANPIEHVAPSPEPPEYPAPPTLSEYQPVAESSTESEYQPDNPVADLEQFGENPDTEREG